MDDTDHVVQEDGNRKRRLNFTLNFKKQAVDFAIRTNNTKAAEKFAVSRQCIQKWRGKKEALEATENGAKKLRLDGAGRHLNDKEFDASLAAWVRDQRQKKLRVTRAMIQFRAKDNQAVKASNGWVECFLRRHRFVTRRPTSVCQKPPDEFAEKIVSFLLYIEKRMAENQYSFVYACDETAVYLDFSKSLTVEERGSKQVTVTTTGHDKLHVTVMLCARSDGYKCRPFVLLPNKRPIPSISNRFGKDLELSWTGKTFFNDDITKHFLTSIIGSTLFGKRLLIWDAYRCHISCDTKKALKALKVDVGVIPGGTTKFIQPADVYWNSPFKAKIRQYYENWMIHGVKTYTTGGNMRAPGMEVYLQWIVDSWKTLPVDLIKKSFPGCGLIDIKNGENDQNIHCFKATGEIPDGLTLLQRRRDEMNNSLDEVEELIEEMDINEDDSQIEEDDMVGSDTSIDIENI